MYSQDNRQLLCTFSNINEFRKTATAIKNFYEVFNNRIFAFCNSKDTKEIYLTYNVLNMHEKLSKFPNTILIHRKKLTNTLYTLNAMNRLIEEECGSADNTYIVNWQQYSNSLIITNEVSIRIVPLKISSILD